MPDFPQIGIYIDDLKDSYKYPKLNQGLMICEDCGHIQLASAVDPDFLYDASFTHRTSESPSAMESNAAFANFVKRSAGGRRFKRAVEIGCSDSFLLQKILDCAETGHGIDPIWKGREDKFTEYLEPDVAGRLSISALSRPASRMSFLL